MASPIEWILKSDLFRKMGYQDPGLFDLSPLRPDSGESSPSHISLRRVVAIRQHIAAGRLKPYIADEHEEGVLLNTGKLVVARSTLRIDHDGCHLDLAAGEYLLKQ